MHNDIKGDFTNRTNRVIVMNFHVVGVWHVGSSEVCGSHKRPGLLLHQRSGTLFSLFQSILNPWLLFTRNETMKKENKDTCFSSSLTNHRWRQRSSSWILAGTWLQGAAVLSGWVCGSGNITWWLNVYSAVTRCKYGKSWFRCIVYWCYMWSLNLI